MAAPKGNDFAKGNSGGGRPSSYRPEYAKIAKQMCELGATQADLALAFDVAIATIWAWQNEHQEFSESVRVGKSAADDRVQASFYQRAVGYEYKAEKIMSYEGAVIRAEYVEHVPADVSAGRYWLSNRRKSEWQDTAKINHDIDPQSPLAKLAAELASTAIRPKEI